jgi:hypothetical protein
MAIDAPHTPIGLIDAYSTPPGGPPYHYSLYGMHVWSDIRLPVAPIDEGNTPDWVFRRAGPERRAPEPDGPMVAELGSDRGETVTTVHRGPGGSWIRDRWTGTFHISPDARRVDVFPNATVDDETLAHALTTAISIFVMHQLGHLTLHASAVDTCHGAVAFLGPVGQGKSTMAASFLRRGAVLLTDDALPVRLLEDGVYGMPSVPLMKVWPKTAEAVLALTDELPNLLPNYAKKLLRLEGRYAFAQAKTRLQTLYVLDRYDPAASGRTDIGVRVLSNQEAVGVFLAHTSWRNLLPPSDLARVLPIYARLATQMPVSLLSFPHGFEHADAVYARIMTDLERR